MQQRLLETSRDQQRLLETSRDYYFLKQYLSHIIESEYMRLCGCVYKTSALGYYLTIRACLSYLVYLLKSVLGDLSD